MECYIRSKSELFSNAKKKSTAPPGITRDTTVCVISGTEFTDSVGEILRNKTSQKELRSFIHDKILLQTHAFELVYRAGFGHMMTRVPNIL